MELGVGGARGQVKEDIPSSDISVEQVIPHRLLRHRGRK